VIEATVEALSQGKVVGWFQGRMEFGPRALGGRSILADARLPGMQAKLNEAVKMREPFRPFAPAVPVEVAGEWFEMDRASPYMLVTVPLKAARRTPAVAIPAVTHVDYSARVQTVDREVNPRFHALLTEFGRRTGCPVLVNTSFNVRGEPVVCTPEDAFRCFLGTGLDVLVVEDCVLYKEQQEAAGRGEAACWFEPD
jgi:carbamoyltransferase